MHPHHHQGYVWHPLKSNSRHPTVDAGAAAVITNVSIPLEDVAVYIKGMLLCVVDVVMVVVVLVVMSLYVYIYIHIYTSRYRW